MPLAAYPGVSFFIRAVHVLPVIAIAAAVGGIIGGFTVYAVDSALTWPRQPNLSQRSDLRGDNLRADSQSGSQSSAAAEQQRTRPVRIVGGAILDPSAGMSAPPPAQSQQSTPQQSAQQQSAAQQNPAQLTPQILAAKPLGPPTSLQAPSQAPSPSQSQAATTAQSTRWPDALSRARQNSSTTSSAQQQTTAPQPNPASEPPTGKTADEKKAGNERAVNADDEDRASRRGRHGRRLDARAYERFYNSYGYVHGRDETGSRYDIDRRYGRYSRYRSRSREIVPDRPEMDQGADRGQGYRGQGYRGQGDRNQATETSQPRPEPFWGGGTRDRFD
jgi:hypothetical protein